MSLQDKLAELGLELPESPLTVAAYLPAVRTGNLVVVSGQLPLVNGKLEVNGPVPSKTSMEVAQKAAAQCVLNGLAALGTLIERDFSRLVGVIRVGVFVASDSNFNEQHLVANGASELLNKLLGEKGRHARTAVGVPCLPLGTPVEIEFMFEVA